MQPNDEDGLKDSKSNTKDRLPTYLLLFRSAWQQSKDGHYILCSNCAKTKSLVNGAPQRTLTHMVEVFGMIVQNDVHQGKY